MVIANGGATANFLYKNDEAQHAFISIGKDRAQLRRSPVIFRYWELRDDEVLVAWIGDGTEIYARASVDGGQSFGGAAVVNMAASAQPCSRLQVARAGSRVYCAWLQGASALSQRRVWAAASPNNGGVWQSEVPVSDQGVNHAGHVLGRAGANASLSEPSARFIRSCEVWRCLY